MKNKTVIGSHTLKVTYPSYAATFDDSVVERGVPEGSMEVSDVFVGVNVDGEFLESPLIFILYQIVFKYKRRRIGACYFFESLV